MTFQRFVDVNPASVAQLTEDGEYFVLIRDDLPAMYCLYRGPMEALKLQSITFKERILTESILQVVNPTGQIVYEDNGVTATVNFDDVELCRFEPTHFTLQIDQTMMTAVLSRKSDEEIPRKQIRTSPRRFDAV